MRIRHILSGFLTFQAILGTMTTHQIDLAVSKDGASKVAAKAGPHGNLIAPKAGKLIRSVGGLGMLSVKFMKYVGNDGQTIGIDINLRPIDNDENRTTYLVVIDPLGLPSPDVFF
jgi:hypothetical protein